MSTKDAWSAPPAPARGDALGPNILAIEALLAQVQTLTRSQIVRIELFERRNPRLLLATWDRFRDRLATDLKRTWRFAARGVAWNAVREAAVAHEIELPADDGYWRGQDGGQLWCRPGRPVRRLRARGSRAVEPEDGNILLRRYRDAVGLPAVVPAR